jgi:hypothetical protein
LHYSTSVIRPIIVLVELLLWIAAVRYLVVARLRRRRAAPGMA